jgi:hypothetical protein
MLGNGMTNGSLATSTAMTAPHRELIIVIRRFCCSAPLMYVSSGSTEGLYAQSKLAEVSGVLQLSLDGLSSHFRPRGCKLREVQLQLRVLHTFRQAGTLGGPLQVFARIFVHGGNLMIVRLRRSRLFEPFRAPIEVGR